MNRKWMWATAGMMAAAYVAKQFYGKSRNGNQTSVGIGDEQAGEPAESSTVSTVPSPLPQQTGASFAGAGGS